MVPEVVKSVASKAEVRARLDDGCSCAEQEKGTPRAITNAELLAGNHHSAVLAVANEDAELARCIVYGERQEGSQGEIKRHCYSSLRLGSMLYLQRFGSVGRAQIAEGEMSTDWALTLQNGCIAFLS